MKKYLIIFLVFYSCSTKDKSYSKLERKFIESYSSLDFNDFSSPRNEVELTLTHKLLGKLVLHSNSDEKYFFNLLRYRLYLIEKKEVKALKELEDIRLINPMMYHFYRGVLFEFLERNNNQNQAKFEYSEAIKTCTDKFFGYYLQYLIDNDSEKFINNLKKYNETAYKFYENKLFSCGSKNKSFRKEIIINEVFNNYYLPKNNKFIKSE